MATTFKEVRKFQGERVRMQFDDGREVVALLLCATKDIDGSKHLIYGKVESVSDVETCGSGATGCFYADGKTLVSIEAADARKIARTLRSWDHFDARREVEKGSPKAWRPCA
jgi:hypothetical protein